MENRESKSKKVQPISKSNPHKFDLNKYPDDEEETPPTEIPEQKESIDRTIHQFDLNEPYYDEGAPHLEKSWEEIELEMLKILLPAYSKKKWLFR